MRSLSRKTALESSSCAKFAKNRHKPFQKALFSQQETPQEKSLRRQKCDFS